MLTVDELKLDPSNKTSQPISLTINDGQTWAVVGPNGSGKSHLLATIAGQLPDFQGKIKINHFRLDSEANRAKSLLGYLPCPVLIEPYLTGFEFLELIGSFYNLSPLVRSERILALADRLHCREQLFTTLERMDQSQRQRIGIIATLLHQPRILIWDEPLLYLDHHSQSATLELLAEALKGGAACILATNDLELAEVVGQHFLLLNEGEPVAQGTLAQLANQFQTDHKRLPDIYHAALHH